MKNKNMFGLLMFVVSMLLVSGFASATCTTTTDNTDADDFFNVTTTTYQTITMTDDQLFEELTYFTPRTNFTIRLTESITGHALGENSTFAITNWANFSSSLDIYNSTNLIDPSNYTLFNTSAKTWSVQWKVNGYDNATLSAIYNRTFVACRLNMTAPTDCDDVVLAPTGIRSGYTTANFITQNTPTSYGEDKNFRLSNATSLAIYMNNTNWAVGWEYTEETCTADCEKPVNDTLLSVILTMFIIGGLVFLGYSLYNGADFKTILITVVGFIVFLIGMLIVKSVLTGVCGTL